MRRLSMKYYFENRDSELISVKAESLEEHERLLRLRYVLKNKKKDVFKVTIKYLVNLHRIFKIEPESLKDKEILEEKIKKLRYLVSLENKLKHDGFNYQVYLKKKAAKLYEFQKVGIEYLVKAKHAILADDVGLGKTIQTITALCHLIKKKEITGKIIIITRSSIKYQWLSSFKEFVDFDVVPELKKNIIVIEGGRKRRNELYKKNAKVYLMNYEQFIHDFKPLVLLSRDIDAVVVDEASKIKNPDAQRTKRIKTLLNNCSIKYLLTATPLENKLLDLYSLVEFLDRKVFLTIDWFKKKYCEFMRFRLGYTGPMITKIKRYKNLNDAKQKIKGLYLRRTAEMVGVQLPKFIVQLRLVDLSKEQQKYYDKIKANDELSISMKMQLLHQICNDPSKLTGGAIKKSAKIDELLNELENNDEGTKAIIFSQYKKFTDAIFKQLKKYKPLYIHGGTSPRDREKFRKMFNKQKDRNILIMTSAGEEGVDAPAGSVVYNMDLPDNPSRLKQRCGRIRRLSSKFKTVRIVNILTRNTIEEKTVKNIFKKMSLFTKFFSEDNANLVSNKRFYKGIDKLSVDQIM